MATKAKSRRTDPAEEAFNKGHESQVALLAQMARVGSSTNPSSSNSLGCPRPLDSEKDAMGQGGCTAYALAKAFGGSTPSDRPVNPKG